MAAEAAIPLNCKVAHFTYLGYIPVMFRKGSHAPDEFFRGKHRFEHWYRDNCIYFITARCRGRFSAFTSEECKAIFWNRFDHYSAEYDVKPIVGSLMDNHYHFLAYLREGRTLGAFMQRLHGSVAKLVNDRLPRRITPFWTDSGHQNYFDGCLRSELQFKKTYRYVFEQPRRHGIVQDPELYPHTKRYITLDRALYRALELNTFLKDLPYKRYAKRNKST
jgi:REP element-mobilizing transposase RayT